MECVLEHREAIRKTYNDVSEFSYNVKKNSTGYEKAVNELLDTINEVKELFVDRTEKVISLNKSLEEITWFSDLDEDCLKKVNNIISSGRDLHKSLVKGYIFINDKRKYFSKELIRDYKEAIDDLREICDDLDSVFFILPKVDGFNKTAQKLAQL